MCFCVFTRPHRLTVIQLYLLTLLTPALVVYTRMKPHRSVHCGISVCCFLKMFGGFLLLFYFKWDVVTSVLLLQHWSHGLKTNELSPRYRGKLLKTRSFSCFSPLVHPKVDFLETQHYFKMLSRVELYLFPAQIVAYSYRLKKIKES